ncbi:hypothetical protein GGR57DRAFT_468152, partial [Xylariaceae sp. FL1272]
MQYFVSQSAAQPGDGYALRLLIPLLQVPPPSLPPAQTRRPPLDMQQLRALPPLPLLHPAHCASPNPQHGLHALALSWPKYKTAYGHAVITIDNGSQAVVPMVDTLLHDRRVCLRFSWEEGDVLVSDNVSM